MYDEKRIEDSLEFCRQIKYYKTEENTGAEQLTKELFGDMSQTLEHSRKSWECILDKKQLAGNLETEEETVLPQQETASCVTDIPLAEEQTEKKASRLLHWITNIFLLIACVCLAYVLSILVSRFAAHQTQVEGQSMEPTLHNDDSLIIQKVSYYFKNPERYDVIVFPMGYNVETGKDSYFIKRIIGLPGETVQILDGKVYIDGKKLTDDIYAKEDIMDPGQASEPIALSEEEYFVLGDNRNKSTDSRSDVVGLVKRKDIAGEAWCCIWPFSHFGVLT